MKKSTIIFLLITFILSEERKDTQSPFNDPFRYDCAGKIGDNPFPTNPMSDRAKGFIVYKCKKGTDIFTDKVYCLI